MNMTQIDLLARRLFDALKQVADETGMHGDDHKVAHARIEDLLSDLRDEADDAHTCKPCEACDGYGYVRYQTITGSGAMTETDCSECEGKGWV